MVTGYWMDVLGSIMTGKLGLFCLYKNQQWAN
jgi:hypothetical protein